MNLRIVILAATAALSVPAWGASLLTNGGFESGLAGWARLDQVGSEGTFFPQSGTTSPVNMFPVPAPPEGTGAAMTDAEGPGSHVLYQDFLIPTQLASATVTFSLFINNGAPDFFNAADLDFSMPALNQRARVDILTTTADPFSINAADVLLNLFETKPGDPLTSGYTAWSTDVTALFRSYAGQTLRLRFAETDNVGIFNFGVDRVSVDAPIPEPGTWVLSTGALCALVLLRRRLTCRAPGTR